MVSLALTAACLVTLSACGGSPLSGDVDLGEIVYVQIEMEDGGIMKLELYPKEAPITCENFVNLAKSGFYDGLIFHRVVENFMIQGGSPDGTVYGNSDKTIKGEFAENGVENNIKHERGVIYMGRNSISMDSASCQFFICHVDYPSLDGKYAAFGRVIEGLEVLDAIASVKTDGNDKPLEDVVIKSITVLD